jgi:hypothetical protein
MEVQNLAWLFFVLHVFLQRKKCGVISVDDGND